jgi:hypothetical protein
MYKLDRWYLRQMVEQCDLSMQVNPECHRWSTVEATIQLQGTGSRRVVGCTKAFVGTRSAECVIAQMLYDDLEVGQGCAKPDIWKNDLKVQLVVLCETRCL